MTPLESQATARQPSASAYTSPSPRSTPTNASVSNNPQRIDCHPRCTFRQKRRTSQALADGNARGDRHAGSAFASRPSLSARDRRPRLASGLRLLAEHAKRICRCEGIRAVAVRLAACQAAARGLTKSTGGGQRHAPARARRTSPEQVHKRLESGPSAPSWSACNIACPRPWSRWTRLKDNAIAFALPRSRFHAAPELAWCRSPPQGRRTSPRGLPLGTGWPMVTSVTGKPPSLSRRRDGLRRRESRCPDHQLRASRDPRPQGRPSPPSAWHPEPSMSTQPSAEPPERPPER